MKKLLGLIVLGLLLSVKVLYAAAFCDTSKGPCNIRMGDFYKLIKEKGNTGFVLRYHNEKSPSGYEIEIPKNSPPIISDFKSGYGVLGGYREAYAKTNFENKHEGVDFYVEPGLPIIAAADGKVYGLKVKDKCVGNQFAIYFGKSTDGTKLYATHMHVGKMHVKKGDKVKRGQLIADAGEVVVGCGGGMEHLHFQLSKKRGSGQGWGSYKYLGGPKGWLNPHEYWTGGRGKPECFVEGKEYPEGLLTLPVKCRNL